MIQQNKERFISILRSTGRQGIENVISKLEELGFFTAPASTVYHLNEEGGLLQHSLNVYDEAVMLREQQIKMRPNVADRIPEDSVTIAALLHDVCKAEIYKKAIKSRKTASGGWEKYEGYEVDNSAFPCGHGEKSVIQLLRWGLDMTDDEILAIRWHMGPWDLAFQSAEQKGSQNAAKSSTPLLSIIAHADGLAASILEEY